MRHCLLWRPQHISKHCLAPTVTLWAFEAESQILFSLISARHEEGTVRHVSA